MSDPFRGLPFRPAGILLPRDCDLSLWSVVACDQYTSQPEYWQRVEERVGKAPSALRLILPESCLEGPGVETDIVEINNTMTRYLREGRFTPRPDCLIYVERTLYGGGVRRGLVGMVDLEQYDYEAGSGTSVRSTEQVVPSRIPPRVAVRKNAPIELPHAQLLMDDPAGTVLEALTAQTGEMEPLYDFELMERGGRLRGWALTEGQKEQTAAALRSLADPAAFRARYGLTGEEPVLLFAVGDGNHSLATARECWERQKRLTPPSQREGLPARYALCELNNLHEASLKFEPIHRVLFGVEPQALLEDMLRFYPDSRLGAPQGSDRCHVLPCHFGGQSRLVTVLHPEDPLPAATLQRFLDGWLAGHPQVRIDYVHGEDVALRLAGRPGTAAFLLPPMRKEDLFPAVIRSGALPRKTFSMGRPQDKRFYLEARKIRQ